MNRWLSVAVIWCACLSGVGTGAYASGLSDMQEEVVKILSQLKFPLADQTKFCRQFLKDFQAQATIKYVKPIVATNDYNDPALEEYTKKCPKLDMTKRVWYTPKIADSVKSFPVEEREQFGEVYRGTSNFKLYRVDINNNRSDGEEFVFYQEKFLHVRSHGEEVISGAGGEYDDRGEYLIVNFRDCVVSDGVGTNELRQFATVPDYNAILSYLGRQYILDLRPSGGPETYSLVLWGYDKKRSRMGTACTIHPTISKAHDEK